MALIVPDAAEAVMLGYILNQNNPQDLTVRLYSNNVTPSEASAVIDFTEVVGGGYAAVPLTAGSWGIVTGDPSTASYPQITWTFTGAVGNVYGIFVTRDTAGDLMWAELFTNGPYNITTNGDQIKVTLRLTLE
jgi:hypothetical protein